MSRIFTIGHSNRQWNDFIFLLQANHIDLLVDVRRYPGSKLCPQFNKEEMTRALKKKNIVYLRILRNLAEDEKTLSARMLDLKMMVGKTRASELFRLDDNDTIQPR